MSNSHPPYIVSKIYGYQIEDFTEKELKSVLSTCRNLLALVGAIYLTKKTFDLALTAFDGLKIHGLSRIRKTRLVEAYGKWAVITGCTDGIGAAFVFELAAGGMNILLLSHNKDQLDAISSYVEKTFGGETDSVCIDFSKGESVYDQVEQRLTGKDIGILVNNVGVMYDYPQYFLEVSSEKLWQLVHVNIAAAMKMTHMVLPYMVSKGRGAVVTVSSGACFLPSPQLTVYSASKQYLKYFMKALEYEYRSKGITFQCLLPFYVATKMTRYSSTLSNPSFFILTASTYARHAVSTLGWTNETTGYFPHSIQLSFAMMVPEWLWYWGATRLNNALRRQAHQGLRSRSGDTTCPATSS